jgi:hypothetical protein
MNRAIRVAMKAAAHDQTRRLKDEPITYGERHYGGP